MAKLREEIIDSGQLACLDKIAETDMAVFEAWSFQDIAGQRVSKVVKSVSYVEERIDALIGIWGKDELERRSTSSRNGK